MQLVHNDALLDSSIYGLARYARSSINLTRPIKHYIMDLLHLAITVIFNFLYYVKHVLGIWML
jgi:hypothetical protein